MLTSYMHRDLSADEAQAIAEPTVKTLQMMRNDEAFSLFLGAGKTYSFKV